MRSNRPSYSASPAGSAKALRQKPKPRRPKQEWNQMFLMLFFVLLPVIGVLAIFFQPVRWGFMILAVASLAAMWVMHAFLFPGRMIVTAVYGLLLVFTLVTALNTQSSRAQIRQQQPGFVTMNATPMPTQAPQFAVMSTSVPSYYYSDGTDALSGIQGVGLSGGSGDESQADLGITETGATGYVSDVKSGAEIALENFMEKWRKGIIADMVGYTARSWRDAQAESAERQLFWKFAQRPLIDWRQMAAPTGTEESTARTITLEADVTYGGEARTYQYDAIVLREGTEWLVDPDSLHSGVLVPKSTATPDPNATPEPTDEPTPTPTPGSKTKLYYNKDGGRRYHADPECYTVDKKYLPLDSFTYGNISKSPYNKLEPCDKCDAPDKP
ncbi:MAG: NADH dehydrogenase subunit 6 [Clostridia bacterium]|nr:NADH dehydrogenase subunit 6 [Clostridia bacterium]